MKCGTLIARGQMNWVATRTLRRTRFAVIWRRPNDTDNDCINKIFQKIYKFNHYGFFKSIQHDTACTRINRLLANILGFLFFFTNASQWSGWKRLIQQYSCERKASQNPYSPLQATTLPGNREQSTLPNRRPPHLAAIQRLGEALDEADIVVIVEVWQKIRRTARNNSVAKGVDGKRCAYGHEQEWNLVISFRDTTCSVWVKICYKLKRKTKEEKLFKSTKQRENIHLKQ